jgi:hypothetical protein
VICNYVLSHRMLSGTNRCHVEPKLCQICYSGLWIVSGCCLYVASGYVLWAVRGDLVTVSCCVIGQPAVKPFGVLVARFSPVCLLCCRA